MSGAIPYREFTRRCAPYYGWLYHFEGTPRIATDAVVIPELQLRRMHHAAARMSGIYDELCALLRADSSLLGYFELTPSQRLMWDVGGQSWRGIARADVFLTTDGRIQVCEVNSDTPGGVPDAVIFNRAVQDVNRGLWDPNSTLEHLFKRWIERRAGNIRTTGIVFPPELAEDTSIIFLYRDWLEDMGARVLLGAPANLHPHGDGVGIFGERLDFMFRHYKTDEWVPQRNGWTYDPEASPSEPPRLATAGDRPTYEPHLTRILTAMADKNLGVLNPFGTIVTQSKLSLSFMWDMLSRFSSASQKAIADIVPETRKLAAIGKERVIAEQDQWVIKSSYGFEGNEAVCGRFESPQRWRQLVSCADASVWVAQRFFDVQPEASGLLPNYGVFIIDGEPAGCLYRVSRYETNASALCAPAFVALASAMPVQVPAVTTHAAGELPPARPPADALPTIDTSLVFGTWPPANPAPQPPEPELDNRAADPMRLIDAWQPYDTHWEPYGHTTIMNSSFKRGTKAFKPLLTEGMRKARDWGERVLAEMLASPGGGRDVLFWVDLVGEEAIAFASGLARGYTPVVRIDGFDHPRGAQRTSLVVAAMEHYAEELRSIPRDPRGPGAIIQDSRRLIDCDQELDRVFNSYVGIIPPAALLVEMGVRRVRAIYEGVTNDIFAAPRGLLLEGFDEPFAAALCRALAPTAEPPPR